MKLKTSEVIRTIIAWVEEFSNDAKVIKTDIVPKIAERLEALSLSKLSSEELNALNTIPRDDWDYIIDCQPRSTMCIGDGVFREILNKGLINVNPEYINLFNIGWVEYLGSLLNRRLTLGNKLSTYSYPLFYKKGFRIMERINIFPKFINSDNVVEVFMEDKELRELAHKYIYHYIQIFEKLINIINYLELPGITPKYLEENYKELYGFYKKSIRQ